MEKQKTAPDGYMTDSQGRLVPAGMVSEIDKLRDETVRAITAQAAAMQEQLLAFKRKIRNDLLAYIDLSFERYGKKFGGKEGNVTLTSYDGEYRLILAVDKVLYFDEGLQAAKGLIDGCITRWAEGSRAEILTLINDAFYVEKGGSANAARILGLRRLQIEDPQWKRAMEAITDCIQVSGKKEYLRFYRRDGKGKYRRMPLDAAAL
jgi:hypothetical protein